MKILQISSILQIVSKCPFQLKIKADSIVHTCIFLRLTRKALWWPKNGLCCVLGMLMWYEDVIWFFGNFIISRELEGLSVNGGKVAERNSKSMQFFFLENCWPLKTYFNIWSCECECNFYLIVVSILWSI
jgi:hypothetical protein